MYLQRRNRILRATPAIRNLVAETVLTPNDFIAPLFIDEGENYEIEIPSMPNYFRRSVDLTIKEVKELYNLGVKCVLLFVNAKYESCFYGPFRDALDSAPGFGDKKTYQMNYANRIEAVKEALMDEEEGADIVMVKPGLPYLDIVREVKNAVHVPVSVYNISGEYAMIKAAAKMGWINEDKAILETLTCIKRAGADLIATYFAKDAVQLIS